MPMVIVCVSIAGRSGARGNRKRDGEDGTTIRGGSCLNISTVLFQHCFADAESESGAATRPLCRVERIEDVGEDVWRNTRPVILKARPDRAVRLSGANSQRSFFADLTNRLFRVQDEVQEDLHQLVRIREDLWEPVGLEEINCHICFAKRICLQVQGAVNQFTNLNLSFPRGGWPGEIHEILNDLGGASRLLM